MKENTEGIVLNMKNYKVCGNNSMKGCHNLLPKTSEYFQVNKKKSDGLDNYCKDCRSFLNKIKYKTEKDNKPTREHDFIGYNGLSEIYC